jgi:hypothetical protein
MAVNATAILTGKKMANAGSRMVPNPKPEKKVSSEASSATTDIMTNSTKVLNQE